MIGQKLREARKREGLTQEELAEQIGSQSYTISRYERGKRYPTDEVVGQLADVLELDESELKKELAEERKTQSVEERWVNDSDEVDPWRDRVAASRIEPLAKVLLMSLPMFLDRETWVVAVTTDEVDEEVHLDREALEEEAWPAVLDSPFVERVGERVEWCFKLTFPPEGDR